MAALAAMDTGFSEFRCRKIGAVRPVGKRSSAPGRLSTIGRARRPEVTESRYAGVPTGLPLRRVQGRSPRRARTVSTRTPFSPSQSAWPPWRQRSKRSMTRRGPLQRPRTGSRLMTTLAAAQSSRRARPSSASATTCPLAR